MTFTRRRALGMLPLAAAGIALAACQKTQSTAAPGASVNQADLDFITNAYDVVHFDQELCEIAIAQARDPRVKAMAEKILREANSFRDRVRPIAEAKGITPPQVLRNDLRIRLGHARLQNGVGFDQTFLSDEIATHQEALDRSQSFVGEPGADPQLTAFAREGQDLLRTNLGQLVALQKQIGYNMG